MDYLNSVQMQSAIAEAMQNEEFAAAVGQTTLSVPFISPEKTVRYENHNRLLKLYPDCTGIKTGFTKKAGRCLVSSAERDGARLICVTLNAPDDWNDHMNLYDYGFAQLAERTYTAGFQPISLPVVGGEKKCISLTLQTQESVTRFAAPWRLAEPVGACSHWCFSPPH